MYRPPLHVHVVSHAQDAPAKEAAEDLQKWMGGDPGAPSRLQADVPIYLWRGDGQGAPDVPVGEAACVVLVIVSGLDAIADRAWRARMNALAQRFLDAGQAVVHVALDRSFDRMGPPLSACQAVRAFDPIEASLRRDEIRMQTTLAVVNALRRAVGTAPPRLFLSHAKRDGLQAAKALKRYLEARPAAELFFDAVDLLPSDRFEEGLAAALAESAIIVFLTDAYAGRYWCRWEALIAKRKRRPLVVVNLLRDGEPTSAAYLGNSPTLRLSDGPRLEELADLAAEQGALEAKRAGATDAAAREEIEAKLAQGAARRDRLLRELLPSLARISAVAMLEVLRAEHDLARTTAVRDSLPGWQDAMVYSRAPELATLPPPGDRPLRILHPDPPLPSYEKELLLEHRHGAVISSVTDALAGRLGDERPLQGRRIALSISDPPDRDRFGMTKALQEQAWRRLAQHLLHAGAELGYGGDLRPGGYTVQLFDLMVAATAAGVRIPDDAVTSWLGWPLSLTLDTRAMAELPNVIRVERLRQPAGLDLPEVFVPPNSSDPAARFGWSVGMRAMREEMAALCDARVMLGGQHRAVSPVPGLVDELTTFLDRGKPVYLIGGFGGMTLVLIRALEGERPVELTQAFQDEGGRGPLREHYDAQLRTGRWPGMPPTDFEALVDRLNAAGTAALNNGLTEEENRRLFRTRDPVEMVVLVLEGLFRTIGGAVGQEV